MNSLLIRPACYFSALLLPLASYGLSPIVFTDDFDRADSSEPGFGWFELAGDWEVKEEALRTTEPVDGAWLAVHPDITLSENGFSVSTNLRLTHESSRHGLAFHVQDADNFYALRIDAGGYQLVKSLDGAVSVLQQGTAMLPVDSLHTLQIASESPGVFEYTVTTADGDSNAGNTVTDGDPLSGGQAGLYSERGASAEFDRFHLSLPLPEFVDSSLEIHRAVELVFPTQEVMKYQIQTSTDLENWEDLGEPIQGTGGEISRLISVRGRENRFYRLLNIW